MIKSIEIQMDEILKEVKQDIDQAAEQAINEIAKESVTKLKASSPRNPRGKKAGQYAKGWAVKRLEKKLVVVYNRTDASLTHLLEKGHDVVNKDGKSIGRAGAIPHIAPVREWAANELPERILQEIDT